MELVADFYRFSLSVKKGVILPLYITDQNF